jgi:2-polyprenyl-3-methyl-5-hydroxy-6-metoxy-1,4-benzoquinol methylase
MSMHIEQNKLSASFLSKRIDNLGDSSESEYRKNILSLFEKNCNAKLLDCGCGDGNFTLLVAENIGTQNIYGVDVVNNVKSLSKINFFQGNLNERIPFEDESFDVIHANAIIEHLSNTDLFVKELFRVCKRRGYCVLATPNLSSLHNIIYLLFGRQPFLAHVSDEVLVGTWHPTKKSESFPDGEHYPQHRRLFTPIALKYFFIHYGFEVTNILGSGYRPLPVSLAKIASRIDKTHSAIIIIKAIKP